MNQISRNLHPKPISFQLHPDWGSRPWSPRTLNGCLGGGGDAVRYPETGWVFGGLRRQDDDLMIDSNIISISITMYN